MVEIRVGSQGRIVLPREIRDQLGAEEGAVYVASVEAGRLVLETRESLLRQMQDDLSETRAVQPPSMLDELLAERRQEAARESQE